MVQLLKLYYESNRSTTCSVVATIDFISIFEPFESLKVRGVSKSSPSLVITYTHILLFSSLTKSWKYEWNPQVVANNGVQIGRLVTSPARDYDDSSPANGS